MELPWWAGINQPDKQDTLSPISALPGDVRIGRILLFGPLEAAGMFCPWSSVLADPQLGLVADGAASAHGGCGTDFGDISDSKRNKYLNFRVQKLPWRTLPKSINLRGKISQWPRKSGQGKEHFHSCSVQLEGIQRISWSSWILTDGNGAGAHEQLCSCGFHSFAEILIIFPDTCAAVQRFQPGHQLKTAWWQHTVGTWFASGRIFSSLHSYQKRMMLCNIPRFRESLCQFSSA